MSEIDDETLQYPCQIAKRIGLGVHEVNAFKSKGCRFYGRKTSVAWVREYLRLITVDLGAELLRVPSERPPHSGGNKRGERVAANG